MATKLREVMTDHPVCLDVQTSVIEAAQRMRDDGIGDVIVTEDGNVCGILTDRDIVVRGVAESGDLHETRIGDVCSRDLLALSPDDDVHEAVRAMEERAVRRVPLVENGQPVGIVSIGDLAIMLDERSALGQISAAPSNR
jgi:signal-transduction protein with cAMP-binding, CBS, and nucleotidyltransferase domain